MDETSTRDPKRGVLAIQRLIEALSGIDQDDPALVDALTPLRALFDQGSHLEAGSILIEMVDDLEELYTQVRAMRKPLRHWRYAITHDGTTTELSRFRVGHKTVNVLRIPADQWQALSENGDEEVLVSSLTVAGRLEKLLGHMFHHQRAPLPGLEPVAVHDEVEIDVSSVDAKRIERRIADALLDEIRRVDVGRMTAPPTPAATWGDVQVPSALLDKLFRSTPSPEPPSTPSVVFTGETGVQVRHRPAAVGYFDGETGPLEPPDSPDLRSAEEIAGSVLGLVDALKTLLGMEIGSAPSFDQALAAVREGRVAISIRALGRAGPLMRVLSPRYTVGIDATEWTTTETGRWRLPTWHLTVEDTDVPPGYVHMLAGPPKHAAAIRLALISLGNRPLF